MRYDINDMPYGKEEPDLTKCRTVAVGVPIPGAKYDMFYCAIQKDDCKYVWRFAYDYICKHPANRTFQVPEDDVSETPPTKANPHR